MRGQLYEYVVLLLWGWVGLVLVFEGLVAVADRLATRRIPPRVFVWTALALLMVAGFSAWRSERVDHDHTRADLRTATQALGEAAHRNEQLKATMPLDRIALEKELEAVRAQLKALEARQANRLVSVTQAQELWAILKTPADRQVNRLDLMYPVNDPEAHRFALQLAGVFEHAGFTVSMFEPKFAEPLFGVCFHANDREPLAQPLAEAFARMGYARCGRLDPTHPDTHLSITVGSKER